MKQRQGFRGRFTLSMAAVLVCGAALILITQYLLVRHLLLDSTTRYSIGCEDAPADDPICDGTFTPPGLTDEAGVPSDVSISGYDSARIEVTESTQVSQAVLAGLVTWSAVILIVVIGAAVVIARWFAGASVRRIATITDATREISREDLHRRLNVGGPDDEIRALGDTIDGMLDRLEDAFTRQDRFIAGASHELRTPLATARSVLEIPLVQGRVPAEFEGAVVTALAANERSERIVAALLSLAQVRHRAAESEELVCDLAELAAVARADMMPLVDERQIEISAVQGQALVFADPGLVAIAVRNVIENAVVHNVEQGAVHIRCGAGEESAWIEVSNDGAELESDLSHLKEPFNRGAQTRLTGAGLGLGLALVETIASSQDGELTLRARSAGGLVVRLSFPVVSGLGR